MRLLAPAAPRAKILLWKKTIQKWTWTFSIRTTPPCGPRWRGEKQRVFDTCLYRIENKKKKKKSGRAPHKREENTQHCIEWKRKTLFDCIYFNIDFLV
mmetsp:Transcript_27081/g.56728  ORF Transcript_27081/g.56728 Transcript_27081/m.56728 type:complete len:98 (+) Transcript_27081:261-554(+)